MYNSTIKNLKAMREIVKTKVRVDEDNYVITDKKGWKFNVNIKTGIIHRKIADGDWVVCNNGMKSKKENGYVYVDINFDIDNKIETKAYGQHTIVAMVAHEEQFDELFNGKNLVLANHMNNCPWNNTSDNLEWTTNKWNKLHGVVIHSINVNKSIQSDLCTEMKFNKNDEHAHIALANGQSLSVNEIEQYEKFIQAKNPKVKSLRKYWGIVDKDSENNQKLIKAKDLVDFLVWLGNYRENSANA